MNALALVGLVGPTRHGWCTHPRNHRQRRADCGGRGCVGCVQGDGGVVAMLDGAVTFKGGTISKTKAVRTRPFRLHIMILRYMSCMTMRATWWVCHVVVVQSYGGVLAMEKGTALFDAVAISDTEAVHMAGRGRGGDASRVDVRGGGCGRCAFCGAWCTFDVVCQHVRRTYSCCVATIAAKHTPMWELKGEMQRGRNGGAIHLVCRLSGLMGAVVMAACSPWPRAPRYSTPWRYPAPEQCVRERAGRRCESGRCASGRVPAKEVRGRLRRAWLRRLCAVRQWRRGSHGRWGRHVQGQLDQCCIGAPCTLHRRRIAFPHRLGVWYVAWRATRGPSSMGQRAGFAVAERRCDAHVPRLIATAACSPCSRAPRCSKPWRYPTPKHRCGTGRGGGASRADARWGGCGRTGCRADCNRRGCAGCAQKGGGVVRMVDGAVTFKNGTISDARVRNRNGEEVGAPVPHVVGDALYASCCTWRMLYDVCCALWHGRWMARTIWFGFRRGWCCSYTLHGVRCVPPEWSWCEYSLMIVAEGADPSRLGVLHS